MGFKLRLTFYCVSPGVFQFEEPAMVFQIADGLEVTIVARDGKKLSETTRFHMERGGFPDEPTARSFGERLRLRLRVLNSILGLGIAVPTIDRTSASPCAEMKGKAFREYGLVVVDSIVGLGVIPDEHVECIVAGEASVQPSDSRYLFDALSRLWALDMRLDDTTQDALEILSYATLEQSARTRFLLTYLAAERLIPPEERCEAAKSLIEKWKNEARNASLEAGDAEALRSALGTLKRHSFKAALVAYARRIDNPPQVKGRPLLDFLSDCVDARNAIAHDAILDPKTDLNALSDGLRLFVMKLIWTLNGIPSISIDVPPSAVSIAKGGLTIRIL